MAARQRELGQGQVCHAQSSFQQCMILIELKWGYPVWFEGISQCRLCLPLVPAASCASALVLLWTVVPQMHTPGAPTFSPAALVPYCKQPRPWALVLPTPPCPA